jgi:predicted nuclease with TOPRIM domain
MEIKKLNPEDFGLSQESVMTIEQAFIPKIIERDALLFYYEQIIVKEITPELCKEAKEIRLKLVKVRTGIADIHKSQKNFFLQAGKFVDSWKNKETIPVEQMEEKLKEIETYYERIEAKRIKDLEEERTELLRPYVEFIPSGLGQFDQMSFDRYLAGEKIAHAAKVQEEQRIEKERLEKEKSEKEETERLRKENEQLKADLSTLTTKIYIIPAVDELLTDKDKLKLWVDSFEISLNVPGIDPTIKTDAMDICNKIVDKFYLFKKWSLEQIKTIK